MAKITHLIFTEPPQPVPKRLAVAKRLAEEHPLAFPTTEDAADFLRHVFTPKSQTWAYAGNGKSGTSSTFRFLFELEFMSELTVHYIDPVDINPDSVAHKSKQHGIFRNLFQQATGFSQIPAANRFALVRDPSRRAVSSFVYFCKSNEQKKEWMLRDRLWCNALTGFNWESDPMTVIGFMKFLEYVEITVQQLNHHIVNPHWRPQYLNIQVSAFKPGLIGRLEEFKSFKSEVATRLGKPPVQDSALPIRSNAQSNYDANDFLKDPAILRKVVSVYHRDFDLFEYTAYPETI